MQQCTNRVKEEDCKLTNTTHSHLGSSHSTVRSCPLRLVCRCIKYPFLRCQALPTVVPSLGVKHCYSLVKFRHKITRQGSGNDWFSLPAENQEKGCVPHFGNPAIASVQVAKTDANGFTMQIHLCNFYTRTPRYIGVRVIPRAVTICQFLTSWE